MIARRQHAGVGLLALIAAALPAGAQWTPQASGTDAELRGSSAASSRVAWASGARGTVLRTTDGGRSRVAADSILSPTGYRPAAAYWPRSRGARVMAVGLTGTDTSRDGGRSWSTTDSTACDSIALVPHGRGRVRGWAVGPKGRIGSLLRCE
ncbi:MAG: putative protein related to photosystem stability/assembly factor [Gemmatimonadetes bacterium]|nr:putative protein related to photosystem stability/assembly factor [Gemmatimonadota bacterium]